jgi:hypothetical protein
MNLVMVFAVGLALVPQAPELPPLPAVPVPPVIDELPAPVPALPPVAVPLPAAPAAPTGGGTSAHSVGRTAPLGSGSRPAPVVAARDRTPPAHAAPSRTVAPPAGGARSAGRPAAVASARRVTPQARRRERRLRRTVRRLRACLGGLPALERKVLVLRSGLGPRHARSRAQVARTLDLSPRRVRRVERRALRRLREGCARRPAAVPSEPAALAPAAPAFARTVLAATTFAAPSGEPDRQAVKGEHQSSRDSAPSRSSGPEPALAPPAKPRPGRPPAAAIVNRDGETDLTLPLLLAAAAVALVLAARSVRRSLRG